jgi:apolipoprotein N-acyltransferase
VRRLAAPLWVLLSAGLYALAFPSPGWWPLAWLALAPFFAACARASPRRAALLGALWGVAAAWTAAHWLPGMLHDFFATSRWIAWSGFAAVALGASGIHHALFAFLLASGAARGRVHPLAAGLLFAATELARSSFPMPTPWALSAYSQQPLTLLVQAADLAGPYGIAIPIAAVNACLAGLAVPALRARRPLAGALSVALLLLLVLGYGAARLATSFGEATPVRVALVVPHIERSQRYQSSRRLENLRAHLDLTRRAAEADPALVFWPEYAVPFPLTPEQGADELFRASRDLGAELLVGAPTWRSENGRSLRFNSIVLLRDGKASDRYDKVALMPFSETIPFAALFGRAGQPYTAGAGPHPIATRPLRVGMLVCSEAMLPGYARRTTAAGAELLVNPSNDDWFSDEGAAALQLVAASFRAVENRRELVRVAARGESGVVDAHGRIVARARAESRDVLLASEVHGSHARTLYGLAGDLPLALGGTATAAWLLTGYARARRAATSPPI